MAVNNQTACAAYCVGAGFRHPGYGVRVRPSECQVVALSSIEPTGDEADAALTEGEADDWIELIEDGVAAGTMSVPDGYTPEEWVDEALERRADFRDRAEDKGAQYAVYGAHMVPVIAIDGYVFGSLSEPLLRLRAAGHAELTHVVTFNLDAVKNARIAELET